MWCQNKHYFDHRFCCCRKCPYPSDSRSFRNFSVSNVPLTKVLNHFSYVHTQIVLDTQTHRHTESHTFPSVSLFLKGLPPKQPEGFGCFVCPNSTSRVKTDKSKKTSVFTFTYIYILCYNLCCHITQKSIYIYIYIHGPGPGLCS